MAKNVAVKLADINRDDFLRFIVKTAHAYAISELGMNAFRPLAVDQILCRSNDLDYIVGGYDEGNELAGDPADVVRLKCGTVQDGPAADYVAVNVHLYPLLNTPAHVVIVGAPVNSIIP
jgi:hypothetical protein